MFIVVFEVQQFFDVVYDKLGENGVRWANTSVQCLTSSPTNMDCNLAVALMHGVDVKLRSGRPCLFNFVAYTWCMMLMRHVHKSFSFLARLLQYAGWATWCVRFPNVRACSVCKDGSISATFSDMFNVVDDDMDAQRHCRPAWTHDRAGSEGVTKSFYSLCQRALRLETSRTSFNSGQGGVQKRYRNI